MFYDFVINTLTFTTNENEIGQELKTYSIDKIINCDVQPSNEYIIKKTFGDDIESVFTVFCDDDLVTGTHVMFNNNIYEINGKVDWVDYKIYSLKGCDINVS